MATEVTSGRVQYLKIARDYGFVNIRRDPLPGGFPKAPTPPNELLIIWWLDQSRGPRTLFTNELSRALAHGLHVRLAHADDGAYIEELIVDAPFEGAIV